MAYWDTEASGRPPRLLGEIKGTPTIRLFKPKRKSPDGTHKEVVDYQYERKAKDMKRFLDEQMPNFIEKVNGKGDMKAFSEKAARNGLPKAILFASKANTSPLTKYLSVEFRRRMLLAQVNPTTANKELMEKFGVKDLPALIVIPSATESGVEPDPIKYDGEGFTRNKLKSFLSKYALKDKVFVKKKQQSKQEEAGADTENETKHKAKSEL